MVKAVTSGWLCSLKCFVAVELFLMLFSIAFSSATSCISRRPRSFISSRLRAPSSRWTTRQGSHGFHSRWMVSSHDEIHCIIIVTKLCCFFLGSSTSTPKQVSLAHTSSALAWLPTCFQRKSTSWSTNTTPVFPFSRWSSTPPRNSAQDSPLT